jgi:hypothetical protein
MSVTASPRAGHSTDSHAPPRIDNEKDRLQALEQAYDPGTIRRLEELDLIPAEAKRLEAPKPGSPQLSAVATPVATFIPSNASNASRKPTNLDDLDARGTRYTPGTRLRAVWTL